jgi:hypothetical protein
MNKALSEGLLIDQRSIGFYQSTLLDDMKIPKIGIFPETMKPGRFFSDSESTFSKEELSIKENFQRFYQAYKGSREKSGRIEDLEIKISKDQTVEN